MGLARAATGPYEPRDFVATAGLLFAVVLHGDEDERVLSSLRYARLHGHWQKLSTTAANDYLQAHLPHYLFYSSRCAATVHGVPITDIERVFKPRERLERLLKEAPTDVLEGRAKRLCELLRHSGLAVHHLGLTGSILVGRNGPESDIDLVAYDRELFSKGRRCIQHLCQSGDLSAIEAEEWQRIYMRRGCALSLEDFVWHEQRKWNKAQFDGTKFDLTLVSHPVPVRKEKIEKLGTIELRAQVLDDRYAFDYPARYTIDSPQCQEILSYTQTYAGQANVGERVFARGVLEQTEGSRRLIVGASREAEDHFLRVVR